MDGIPREIPTSGRAFPAEVSSIPLRSFLPLSTTRCATYRYTVQRIRKKERRRRPNTDRKEDNNEQSLEGEARRAEEWKGVVGSGMKFANAPGAYARGGVEGCVVYRAEMRAVAGIWR